MQDQERDPDAVDPATEMTCVQATGYGGTEHWTVFDGCPKPVASAEDHVVVQVLAASLNPADVAMRTGLMRMIVSPSFPFVPGMDMAGVVVESRSDKWVPGDQVFGKLSPYTHSEPGTLAQFTLAHADALARKPGSVSVQHAAAVPTVALTALQGLRRAGLKTGDHVVVLGGAGGVGSMVVQIAKQLGARVTATCSEAKLDTVRSLGADRVINYATESVDKLVTDADIVFDTVAKTGLTAVACLKPGGVYLSIAGVPPPGVFARVPGLSVRVLDALLTVAYAPIALRTRLGNWRYDYFLSQASGDDLDTVAQMLASGQIRAVIDSEFTLEEVREASVRLETGRCTGKVVVNMIV